MIRLVCFVVLLLQEQSVPRIPEPDAEAQKQTLKTLKELFKEEYSKKTAADQTDLARKLVKTSADPSLDSNTRYVCLTEARDLAMAAGEAPVALEAVSLLGKSFMIQVPAAKMAVLAKMSGAARETEKIRALGRAYYDLAREAVVSEDYDSASAAASKADVLGRAIKDASLVEQVGELKKDLVVLKSELQKVKGALDNPATGDVDAAGRYLCFIRNDWAAGLKLLADGGKAPLKDLAAKDLSNPEAPEVQIEVGDGWWQLAQAEKVSWKKLNILGRARRWYDRAAPSATGLVKIRLDKRLVELEGLVPGPVNLLRVIDPKRDAISGEWSVDDGVLTNKGDNEVVVQLPYQPPEEYDLRIVMRRLGSTDSIWTGLVAGNTNVAFVIDGYPLNGWIAGFDLIDGKYVDQQATGTVKGQQFIHGGKDAVLEFQVRKTSITAFVDGKKLLTYEGPFSRLSTRPAVKLTDKKALYLGSWGGKNGWVDVKITPLSGPGRKTK